MEGNFFLALLGKHSIITFQHIVIQVAPQGTQLAGKAKQGRIGKYSPNPAALLSVLATSPGRVKACIHIAITRTSYSLNLDCDTDAII